MRNRLVAAIQETLDESSELRRSVGKKYRDKSPESRELLSRQALYEHIGKSLQNEPEFQGQPHKMIRGGHCASNLTMFAPGTLHKWATTLGPSAAARRFWEL